MRIRIYIAIFAIQLLLLQEAFAEDHNSRYVSNLPVQYWKNSDALKENNEKDQDHSAAAANVDGKEDDEKLKENYYIKEKSMKENDMKEDHMNDNDMKETDKTDDNIKEDDMKENYMEKYENESSVESHNNVISAIGSDMSNLAVLTPADTSILKKAGINSNHIIGYVPVNSPNGHALVFPAGAVRIGGQQGLSLNPVHKKKKIFLRKQEEDENAEEEERGIRRRKRIRSRNTKGKLKRQRSHRNNKRKRRRNHKGNRNQYKNHHHTRNGQRNGNGRRSGSQNSRRRTNNLRTEYRRRRIPYHDYRDELIIN